MHRCDPASSIGNQHGPRFARRDWLKAMAVAAIAPSLRLSGVEVAAGGAHPPASWLAIPSVCAWPKLELLPDGTIVAVIFNQPCHGSWEGDLECWASADQGKTWQRRARVTDHAPTTVRMNCAAGKTKHGDLLALCGGWSGKGPQGNPEKPAGLRTRTLRATIHRSTDGGRTWRNEGEIPGPPPTALGKDNEYIPFGQIQVGADGSLGAAVYLVRGTQREARYLKSRDDGRTWNDDVVLNPTGNETALLHLGEGRWLAASREFKLGANDMRLEQFVSTDDARSWRRVRALTLGRQIPGHLLRLRDGRILLTYGNRCWGNYGVDARVSHDEGETWGTVFALARAPLPDCGYPSCVQLAGGDVVTAYYTQTAPGFHYEMRVMRWNPDAAAEMRGLV